MPTSSERLRARAKAYADAWDFLVDRSVTVDDAIESDECTEVAARLWLEYDRLNKLAEKREQKEKELEHRRKTLTT